MPGYWAFEFRVVYFDKIIWNEVYPGNGFNGNISDISYVLVPDSIPRMFPLGCFRDTSDVSEIPRMLSRYLGYFQATSDVSKIPWMFPRYLGCFRDTLDVSEIPWMLPQFSETAHVSSLSHLDWSKNRALQVVHPYVLYWNFLYLDKIDVKFHLDEFFEVAIVIKKIY